jgi:hypothetical protein
VPSLKTASAALGLFFGAMLVGCGGDPLADPQTGALVEPLETVTWTSVGLGVNYRNTGAGSNVFIAYAGYSGTDAEAESWISALYTAQLSKLKVGHLYAVRGPNDPGYAHREIGNTKLIRHMLGVTDSTTKLVAIAAHSSGAYVANEMFGFLFDSHFDTVGRTSDRTVYYNLDGGSGLTDYTLTQLANAYFVHAYDPSISTASENASVMTALATRSPPKTAGITVTDGSSGCSAGAGWCMHDVVITTRPHNPNTYDLLHDYMDFTGRAVQDSYLVQSWSTLTGLLSR